VKTHRNRVKKPRAVLSIAFGVDEFSEVDAAAERAGVPTSAWVRQAALDRARYVTASVASVAERPVSLARQLIRMQID
jgi:hypothetical protein